jgi:diguanylate cyclase
VTGDDSPDPYSVWAAVFTRRWTEAIIGSGYRPWEPADLERQLAPLTGRLTEALAARPFTGEPAALAGAGLVDAHFTAPEALRRTIAALGDSLLQTPWQDCAAVPPERISMLQAALAGGYAQALRHRTLSEQESIHRAVQGARDRAVGALRASEGRLRHQARHDLLTGLPNRSVLLSRLEEIFAGAGGAGRVGLCVLDLDGFKIINSSVGHFLGDQVLAVVADRLTRLGWPADHLLARTGGDEFVILIPGSRGSGHLVEVAERVLAALVAPVLIGSHKLAVAASIGIVERATADTDPADLMRAADVTLYWAKADGKGRWAQFDPERYAREVAQHTLSTAMPGALDRDEFILDYQPIVALPDGALRGAEALVRWRHPQLGLLPPGRFIQLAEQSGLIVPLGRWILRTACQQARRWQDHAGEAPFISVNLAVGQCHHPGLVDDVASVLAETGLAPDKLQLELTESAMMDTAHEPFGVLHTLADMGVRIAIDDFGTGYSNLAYLRTLPVHTLKIAGPFVAGLRREGTSGAVDSAIVEFLVSLAHTLGLTVTAEEVRTADQARRLHALGCDTAQGNYFAAPRPTEALLALL